QAILSAADEIYAEARALMTKQAVTRYLDSVWAVIAEANRYFAAEEPWAKKKTDPKRMETVLYVTAELVRQFGILTQPVMPQLASDLLDLLAVTSGDRAFVHLGAQGRLKPGTQIPAPSAVFPRYVEPEG